MGQQCIRHRGVFSGFDPYNRLDFISALPAVAYRQPLTYRSL